MKKLNLGLESEDNSQASKEVPEPPKMEKEGKVVVMQGPLSTIMALTLMKRYAEQEDVVHPEDQKRTESGLVGEDNTDQKTETTKVEEPNPVPQTPQSISMEMQMAYVGNVIDKVEANTQASQAEIAQGTERFRNYFTSTTRAGYITLE